MFGTEFCWMGIDAYGVDGWNVRDDYARWIVGFSLRILAVHVPWVYLSFGMDHGVHGRDGRTRGMGHDTSLESLCFYI